MRLFCAQYCHRHYKRTIISPRDNLSNYSKNHLKSPNLIILTKRTCSKVLRQLNLDLPFRKTRQTRKRLNKTNPRRCRLRQPPVRKQHNISSKPGCLFNQFLECLPLAQLLPVLLTNRDDDISQTSIRFWCCCVCFKSSSQEFVRVPVVLGEGDKG